MKCCPYCDSKGPHKPLTTDLGNEFLRCTDCRRRFSPDGEEPAPPAAEKAAQPPADELNTPADVAPQSRPSKKRNP